MDFGRRCQNLTPMEARCFAMDDRHGRAVLVAIAKLTFQVAPTGDWRVLERGTPLRLADRRCRDHPHASIEYPSDYVDEKPGTDVVFVGTAHPPPSSRGVTCFDVSLTVGRLSKSVRVHGPRVFQAAGIGAVAPGPAQTAQPTPLRYELAWGGIDDADPEAIEFCAENPAGLGFAATRHRRVGARAPQLEVVRSLGRPSSEPAGFGPIAPDWRPRIGYAGTYDLGWRRDRAPILPRDFDPRFHCCAHPDLYSATPLCGDEPVEVRSATPTGLWRFQLPRYEPLFESVCRGARRELATHLDTFLVDGDRGTVELCWRASVLLPRKAQLLERITVRERAPLPPERIQGLDAEGLPSPAAAPTPWAAVSPS